MEHFSDLQCPVHLIPAALLEIGAQGIEELPALIVLGAVELPHQRQQAPDHRRVDLPQQGREVSKIRGRGVRVRLGRRRLGLCRLTGGSTAVLRRGRRAGAQGLGQGGYLSHSVRVGQDRI